MDSITRMLVDAPVGSRLFVTDSDARAFTYRAAPGKRQEQKRHTIPLALVCAQGLVRRRRRDVRISFRRDADAGGFWVYVLEPGSKLPFPTLPKHGRLHFKLLKLGAKSKAYVSFEEAGEKTYESSTTGNTVRSPVAIVSLRQVFKKMGYNLKCKRNAKSYTVWKERVVDRSSGETAGRNPVDVDGIEGASGA